MHILVLGRVVPAIAPAAALAAGVTILDGSFLALDGDELRALAHAFGRELSDGELEDIARVTEGWVAGAALALAGWREPDLAKQILSELGADNVAVLEELSVLQTIDVTLLQRHASFAGVRQSLTDMLARGAPIAEMGNGFFRVHPLLRDLARNQLRARGGRAGRTPSRGRGARANGPSRGGIASCRLRRRRGDGRRVLALARASGDRHRRSRAGAIAGRSDRTWRAR